MCVKRRVITRVRGSRKRGRNGRQKRVNNRGKGNKTREEEKKDKESNAGSSQTPLISMTERAREYNSVPITIMGEKQYLSTQRALN